MHDCFAVELTGECLKCSFRLTRGGPYLRGVLSFATKMVPSQTRCAPVSEVCTCGVTRQADS